MLKKTIADIQEMQANQIFAILDTITEGTDVKYFRSKDGRLGIRITERDGSVRVVSGASARDVFAQACQVMS